MSSCVRGYRPTVVVTCLLMMTVLFTLGYIQKQTYTSSKVSMALGIKTWRAGDGWTMENGDTMIHPRGIQLYVGKQPAHYSYLIANLTTRKGKTPICLFNLYNDKYISAGIARNGRWEGRTFDAIETLFERNPDWDFLDIGSHVGTFALMAAKWDRKVLAVDSSFESIRRLRKSCDIGGLSDQIVTVWNAIGDKYKTVTTTIWPGNYAAGYIVDINDGINEGKALQEPVPMIHLDDLLVVTDFKAAIMKLDIEGYEAKALEHADELFKTINIPYVFMKWHILRADVAAVENVISFFTRHDYIASGINDFQPLGDIKDWPETYCWVKVSRPLNVFY